MELDVILVVYGSLERVWGNKLDLDCLDCVWGIFCMRGDDDWLFCFGNFCLGMIYLKNGFGLEFMVRIGLDKWNSRIFYVY